MVGMKVEKSQDIEYIEPRTVGLLIRLQVAVPDSKDLMVGFAIDTAQLLEYRSS
jgi:hypothetical protein